MLKRCIFFLLSLTLLIFPAVAETKNFVITATSWLGDNQTKNDARNLATLEAKRLALEQTGTYIESISIVKNSMLEKNEILAITAGVTKTEIIEEKTVSNGDSFGLQITAKITVDSSFVEAHIKNLLNNREALEREKQLLERNQQLERELNKYKEELSMLKNSEQVQELRKTEGKALEDKLSATEWFHKGVESYNAKEFDQGIICYTKAISLDPNYAYAYNNRGNAYSDLGQKEKAIQDYNKAISLDPNDAIAYYNRGNAYFDLGQNEKAIQDYNKAISINPNYALAYNNRGNAYSDLGQNERAIQDFSKAISIDPNYALAYNNRGYTYSNSGQNEKAIQDFSKACELGLTSTCSWLKDTGY